MSHEGAHELSPLYGADRTMTRPSIVLLALALATASAACSSSGTTSDGAARANRNRNLITAADLADVTQPNVFDAIRRLRPAWLRVRGRGIVTIEQQSTIRVYIDEVLRGSTRLLGRIRPSQVQEIRYLEPNVAEIRYGASHRDGAIRVTLRQPG